jgi:hypothetical protein
MIGAGCGSNAPSQTGTATVTAEKGSRTEQFAGCMRKNGITAFPDANGSSDQAFVEAIEKLHPNSAAFKKALGACKDLQPPGLLGGKSTPQQMSARLEFATCIRENGVKDFPDPVDGEPLVNTYKIPSSSRPGGMAILNAAMKTCGDAAARAIGDK